MKLQPNEEISIDVREKYFNLLPPQNTFVVNIVDINHINQTSDCENCRIKFS